MIVQINVDEYSVDTLKRLTRQATASKAYLEAANEYQANKDLVAHYQIENQAMRDRISQLEQVIDSMDGLCRQMLEITGQETLFD